jgi:hypothetical protein
VRGCGTKFAIDIDELKEIANGQVRAICMNLLPNGREACGYWEVGSIEGEPGQSLKVNLRGSTVGLWTDFAAPPGAPDRQGNILQLVAAVRFSHNVGHACQWLRSFLGLDNMDPNRLAAEKARATRAAAKRQDDHERKLERNRRKAHELFLGALPYPGTPAETYLKGRAIDFAGHGLEPPGAIRFRANVYCAETRGDLPAMLAPIVGLDGRHRGTHRTYLQADGSGKALLAEAKKSLGKFQGGFIPLWKGKHQCSMQHLPPGTPIYVSEGIEDGLSAVLAKPEIRCIAGVSLSNIGGLELPEQCPVHLLAQRDDKMQALEAFDVAVQRLQDRGHDVFLIYPPAGFKDYNDLLRDAARVGGRS